MHFNQLHTHGGYNCGEVASALQKSVRRGDVDEALFWASELDISGFGEYTWKRLRIMASEDVGIADSTVALQVKALYDNWSDVHRKAKSGPADDESLFLVHAVILLCEAPKSRLCDSACLAMYWGQRPKREIPDHALDMHTTRGKAMRRGVAHFYEEGARIENAAPIPNPYLERGRQAHEHPIKRKAGDNGRVLEPELPLPA